LYDKYKTTRKDTFGNEIKKNGKQKIYINWDLEEIIPIETRWKRKRRERAEARRKCMMKCKK
jgi:hypothetical protein